MFEVYGEHYNTSSTVTYNTNGADSGSVPIDGNSYEQGALVTVAANSNNLARVGHLFRGWALSSSATSPTYIIGGGNGGVVPSIFVMGISNVVLFAVWAPDCTVTYVGDDGWGGTAPTDSSSPYKYGSTVTVLGQGSLSYNGWYFIGIAILIQIIHTYMVQMKHLQLRRMWCFILHGFMGVLLWVICFGFSTKKVVRQVDQKW
jgi:hypothetical protein